MFLPLPVGFGAWLYFALSFEPSWSSVIVPLIVSLSGFISLDRVRFDSTLSYGQWICLGIMALVCTGFASAKLETSRKDASVLTETIRFANITGHIQSIEKLPGRGGRVILSNLDIEEIPPNRTPRQIRVKIWDIDHLAIGQRIRFLGQLSPPSAPVSPGGFDFQRYAFFHQLGAFGFSFKKPDILEKAQQGGIAHFRHKMQQQAHDVLPPGQAGVATALLTGIRGGISEDLKNDLRFAGLAHLLAISGLHVGLIAGALFFVSRLIMALFPLIALYWPTKKIAALIALAGALFYTIFVGAPVPTQRAMIMTAIALFAIMVDRSPFSMRLVAVAALAILLFQPSSLMGASFQLSFAAVIALIAFYEAFRERFYALRRIGTAWGYFLTYLAGIMATSVIATIGTAPFTLYHFQEFPPYSVLGNLLAMPIMVFWVMPAAVVSFVLWPLGLAQWPLIVMGSGISWITAGAAFVSDLPGAVIRVPQMPGVILGLMVAGGLWLCLINGRERLAGLLPLTLAAILAMTVSAPDIRISENGKLVGIRQASGDMVFSTRRSDSFTREIWARQNAQSPDNKTIFSDQGSAFPCDSDGCRAEIKGFKIAISRHPYAHAQDCRWADIVIARSPVFDESCRRKKVIDKFDVWRNGAYALWLSDDSVKVRAVEYDRGGRPWMIPRVKD